jgi:hypothetical protein
VLRANRIEGPQTTEDPFRSGSLGSSVNKGEEEFCELRHNGVLGSSA